MPEQPVDYFGMHAPTQSSPRKCTWKSTSGKVNYSQIVRSIQQLITRAQAISVYIAYVADSRLRLQVVPDRHVGSSDDALSGFDRSEDDPWVPRGWPGSRCFESAYWRACTAFALLIREQPFGRIRMFQVLCFRPGVAE